MSRNRYQLDFGLLEPDFRRESTELESRMRRKQELVIAAAREVVEFLGFEQAATILGRPRGVISQALAPNKSERNHQHLYLEHVPLLVAAAPTDTLINTISAAAEPEFTGEEMSEAVVEAAREFLGAEVHRGLMRRAYQRALKSRREQRRREEDAKAK